MMLGALVACVGGLVIPSPSYVSWLSILRALPFELPSELSISAALLARAPQDGKALGRVAAESQRW